jgi:NAD(P)-dependent dehydrogenase (short-subunit alcohol dehydrogenase family)
MRGLQGKVALDAGAAPGNIGAAAAVRLAEEGNSVVAADFNESAARTVADVLAVITCRPADCPVVGPTPASPAPCR